MNSLINAIVYMDVNLENSWYICNGSEMLTLVTVLAFNPCGTTYSSI